MSEPRAVFAPMDPNAPPAPPSTPPATPPAAPPAPPATVTRPEWLPEAHWDTTANTIKPEFGAHFTEIATFHKTETEKAAALAARKPEDIKFEIVLPETVKVPDGMALKIDDKDPRVPVLRDLAVKHGLSQDVVTSLVAFDAQQQIEAHAAEQVRIAAEDQKLGANAKDRKTAASNWLKGMKDRGELTAEEYEASRAYATDAATVTFLEKLMAKANGTVPGTTPTPPPPPAPKDHATRIWGEQAFKANPTAKAS